MILGVTGSSGSPHISARTYSSSSNEELQRPESVVIQPQHIRVMLPVEDRDRQKPIIQKTQSNPPHQRLETHFEGSSFIVILCIFLKISFSRAE
jgi:hypothetical protein